MESSCGLAKTEQMGKVKTVTARAKESLKIEFIECYLTERGGDLTKQAKVVFYCSLVFLKICRVQAKTHEFAISNKMTTIEGSLKFLRLGSKDAKCSLLSNSPWTGSVSSF